MAMVEIARFTDVTEAQTAASALRASGIPVLIQNEFWGQNQFYMQIAMGGFRLWTPQKDAVDAKAFIAECRQSDREALNWGVQRGAITGVAPAFLGLFLFWLGGWAPWGWTVAAARQRPTLTRIATVAVLTAITLGFYWFIWAMMPAPADGP